LKVNDRILKKNDQISPVFRTVSQNKEMEPGFFQARQGWPICSIAIHQRTKLRQRHHRACGGKMPPRTGLKIILILGATNMPRLTALGILGGATW
jgi:hypothetical protein